MQTYLSGADLFAFIQMLRQVDPRLVLVVEGIDDCAVVDPHLDSTLCHSLPAYGQRNAVDAGKLLTSAGVQEAFVFIDRDYMTPTDIAALPARFATTENHDLEADIFFAVPEATQRIVAAHADRDAVAADVASGLSPYDSVVEAAAIVGALRHISVSQSLGLNLRDFPIQELVANNKRSGSYSTVAGIAVARSPSTGATSAQLEADLAGLVASASFDRRWFSSGHDLVAALAVHIRLRWKGSASKDVIGRAFRSVTGCAEFARLAVYAAVATWAASLGYRAWTCP